MLWPCTVAIADFAPPCLVLAGSSRVVMRRHVLLQDLGGSLVPVRRESGMVLRHCGGLRFSSPCRSGDPGPMPRCWRHAALGRRAATADGAAEGAPGEGAEGGNHSLGHAVGVDDPDGVPQHLAVLVLLATLRTPEGLQDHAEVVQARQAEQRVAARAVVVEVRSARLPTPAATKRLAFLDDAAGDAWAACELQATQAALMQEVSTGRTLGGRVGDLADIHDDRDIWVHRIRQAGDVTTSSGGGRTPISDGVRCPRRTGGLRWRRRRWRRRQFRRNGRL
mmetsp:Transcript_38584/g.110865  ORF Transcript_38584/g.110865 Transcript_38584/m.110865 type:complete len:279 (+) Transcript_38584:253-1089(+)